MVFILGLAEGVFLNTPDEPTARVGHVAVFLAALLPGMVVGLLTRSGKRAFLNALAAGLPAVIVLLLLATTDGRSLQFYSPFEGTLATPLDQFIFRAMMTGLLLAVSAAVGRYVAPETVVEPEVGEIREIREVQPLEDVEELEKRIEEEVMEEKMSGVSLVEEAAGGKEAELPTEKEVEAPPALRSVEARLCPSCGAEVPSQAVYCSVCGRKTEEER